VSGPVNADLRLTKSRRLGQFSPRPGYNASDRLLLSSSVVAADTAIPPEAPETLPLGVGHSLVPDVYHILEGSHYATQLCLQGSGSITVDCSSVLSASFDSQWRSGKLAFLYVKTDLPVGVVALLSCAPLPAWKTNLGPNRELVESKQRDCDNIVVVVRSLPVVPFAPMPIMLIMKLFFLICPT